MLAEVDVARRFGAISRLYGDSASTRLAAASVAVVGIGGVGSWVAESLARTGIGELVLVDLDHVAESNINRQIHALEDTLGMAKVEAMRQRLAGINPLLRVRAVDEFIDRDNAVTLLQGVDAIVDAVDQVSAKLSMVLAARALSRPLLMCGGAGGKRDPLRLRVADLALTEQDPLLASVRRKLRSEYGYPRGGRKFGVEAVFSDEPMRYPDRSCNEGEVTHGLACAGYGSVVMVTAAMGLVAAARIVEHILARSDSPTVNTPE